MYIYNILYSYATPDILFYKLTLQHHRILLLYKLLLSHHRKLLLYKVTYDITRNDFFIRIYERILNISLYLSFKNFLVYNIISYKYTISNT